MSKKLVAYFSRTGENYINGGIQKISVGNTEIVAKMIQELTGADLFYIDPVEPYSENYQECIDEAKIDLKEDARPAFKNPLPDLSEYDVIYVGFPNYWGTMPMHVFTFLDTYDFKGKIIKPFCTHEGSGLGNSERDLCRLCPDAEMKAGIAIKGGNVKNGKKELEKWV